LPEFEEKTVNFGFQILRGQPASTDNYSFTDADRVLIDKLLNQIFYHTHTGVERLTNPMNAATPEFGATLSLAETGGSLPADSVVCYRVSWYDNTGETMASPEYYEETPASLPAPSPPELTTLTTGGILTPGIYYYVISAVKGNGETLASDLAVIVVPTTASTNTVTLTFPSPPTGATYWNVYRRKDESLYYFLKQVAVADPTYIDDGSDALGAEGLPSINNTNSENKMTITIGDFPAGAVGYRIYRTYVSGDYPAYSLLHDEEMAATPNLVFEDTGIALEYGIPKEVDQTHGTPPKVNVYTELDPIPESELVFDDTTGHTHTGADAKGTPIAHSDTTGQGTDDHHAQAHAVDHTDGTDDIQSATEAQKGLVTVAQIIHLQKSALDNFKNSFIVGATEEITYDKITLTENIVVTKIDIYFKTAIAGADASNYVTIKLTDDAATPNEISMDMQNGNFFTADFTQEFASALILTLSVEFTEAATPTMTCKGENANITIHYRRKQASV